MINCSKQINFTRTALLLCGFLAFSLTACNNDDDDNVVEPAAVSYVSLYNASPDTAPLDVFFDERRVNFTPLRYTNYTSYLNFFAGLRKMRVRPSGASNVIIDTSLTFTEGQAYSLFFVNRQPSIRALLVKDSLIAAVPGKSSIRIVHLSPDAPPIDLAVTTAGNEGGISTLFPSQTYLTASPFVSVNSGTQSFQIRQAGNTTPLLSIPDVNLLPGAVYTILVRGLAAPPAGNTNGLSAQIIVNY